MYRDAFIARCAILGRLIRAWTDAGERSGFFQDLLARAQAENPWFVPDFVCHALEALADYYLDPLRLQAWWTRTAPVPRPGQRVLVVMAGNLPLVGFHDLLMALALDAEVSVKLSGKDKVLLPALWEAWGQEPEARAAGFRSEQLSFLPQGRPDEAEVQAWGAFDAVLFSGSGAAAARYAQLFPQTPLLLRDSKTSVAWLPRVLGPKQAQALCKDIFLYFGLGCRSVTHLLVPQGFDFGPLLRAAQAYAQACPALLHHPDYQGAYTYARGLARLKGTPYVDGAFFLVRPSIEPQAAVATLTYHSYTTEAEAAAYLAARAGGWQCVALPADRLEAYGTLWQEAGGDFPLTTLGCCQYPHLDQYADRKDTLHFLQHC